MNFSEYLKHDAVGLAQCVARRDVSADELLALALHQGERTQPKTNAICRMMESEARAQLAKPRRGAFAGVPFLIKDCTQDYAGLPTTFGSRSMRSAVAPAHSHVVRRFLEAGLVIFGKTNLPEFALKGVTDSKLFGRAQNPWDFSRTPGGSSGGAAAAVASGVVPMAAGNDGGGSIRPVVCDNDARPLRARQQALRGSNEEKYSRTHKTTHPCAQDHGGGDLVIPAGARVGHGRHEDPVK